MAAAQRVAGGLVAGRDYHKMADTVSQGWEMKKEYVLG